VFWETRFRCMQCNATSFYISFCCTRGLSFISSPRGFRCEGTRSLSISVVRIRIFPEYNLSVIFVDWNNTLHLGVSIRIYCIRRLAECLDNKPDSGEGRLAMTGTHFITKVKQRWALLVGPYLDGWPERVRWERLEGDPASCGLGTRNTAYQRLQYCTAALLFRKINAFKNHKKTKLLYIQLYAMTGDGSTLAWFDASSKFKWLAFSSSFFPRFGDSFVPFSKGLLDDNFFVSFVFSST
jgi:hypothetical protein